MKLFHGDCLDVLKTLPDNSVDSITTDPPYGLSFMNKKWDYDVPSVEIWRECLRVLKHGGHLLSFAGSRTYHRMATNIEDAGFEIRDQIMWVYGSGFPKSHNIGRAVDKRLGNEGVSSYEPNYANNVYNKGMGGGNVKAGEKSYKGTSEWEGWGTALKPAHEPIVVARKPLIGTVVDNVLEHGTGGLNIDGCRVETDEKLVSGGNLVSHSADERTGRALGMFQQGTQNIFVQNPKGRFPANFIHDGSDEVLNLFPQETARFFYCAKASKKERGSGNNHPTVKPIALMRYLCRLITPPNGVVLDPFMGSGTTGIAVKFEGFDFIGIEMNAEYLAIAEERIAHSVCAEELVASTHTTLDEWL